MSINKNRALELDFFRGICILLMLWDHFALIFCKVDGFFWYLGEGDRLFNTITFLLSYLKLPLRIIFRQIIVAIFFTISGIVTQYSRQPLKRGIKLSIVAILITIISVVLSLFFEKNLYVFFGVIHCYAACVLICYLLNKIKNKKLEFSIIIVLIIVSIIFYVLKPNVANHNYLMVIGIPQTGYISGFDYFPVFPYIGVFLFGLLIGRVYYQERKTKLKFLEKPIFKPFIYIGQNGIWIYILHIPIITLIVFIAGRVFI